MNGNDLNNIYLIRINQTLQLNLRRWFVAGSSSTRSLYIYFWNSSTWWNALNVLNGRNKSTYLSNDEKWRISNIEILLIEWYATRPPQVNDIYRTRQYYNWWQCLLIFDCYKFAKLTNEKTADVSRFPSGDFELRRDDTSQQVIEKVQEFQSTIDDVIIHLWSFKFDNKLREES